MVKVELAELWGGTFDRLCDATIQQCETMVVDMSGPKRLAHSIERANEGP